MSTLEQGRIVWAEVLSPDGETRKCRPAVVVTATNEIVPGKPFVVVAATTRINEPLPEEYVDLPWHPRGAVRTKLRKRTAAVCNWLLTITEGDVREFGGIVPPDTMTEIVRKVNELRSG